MHSNEDPTQPKKTTKKQKPLGNIPQWPNIITGHTISHPATLTDALTLAHPGLGKPCSAQQLSAVWVARPHLDKAQSHHLLPGGHPIPPLLRAFQTLEAETEGLERQGQEVGLYPTGKRE